MRVSTLTVSLLLLSFLKIDPAMAAGNMTLEFHEAQTRPKQILVVPVQAQLKIARVGANEPLVSETELWESSTADKLISSLGELGYEVTFLDNDMLAADASLQQMVAQVNTSFDEAQAQLLRKPKYIVERRYNLGSSARALANQYSVDAIVVPRVIASAQAGGALAMTLIVGGGEPSMTLLRLTVVDGLTGDVEALFAGAGGPVNIDKLKAADEETITRMVSGSLKKYPASDESVKMNKRTRKRAVARSVDSQEDEDTLTELEDLIGDNN